VSDLPPGYKLPPIGPKAAPRAIMCAYCAADIGTRHGAILAPRVRGQPQVAVCDVCVAAMADAFVGVMGRAGRGPWRIDWGREFR
jgi:hypothetical protein